MSMSGSEKNMPLWRLVRRLLDGFGRRLQEHQAQQPGARLLASVSTQQFLYLQAIEGLDQATVGRLAEHFGVTPPTATVIVRRLEEQGLIKKKLDADDARIHHLFLTDKGHRLLLVQEGALKALAGDIGKILTREEQRQYARLTEKICTALEAQREKGM